MYPYFGVAPILALVTFMIYLVAGAFALFLAWRLVKAMESIARSFEKFIEVKK